MTNRRQSRQSFDGRPEDVVLALVRLVGRLERIIEQLIRVEDRLDRQSRPFGDGFRRREP